MRSTSFFAVGALWCGAVGGIAHPLHAQHPTAQTTDSVSRLSVETELQAIAQRGYSIGASLWPARSRWSYGIAVAGSEQRGAAREIIYRNGERLDRVRNPWLVRVEVRRHLRADQRGFYGSVRAGYEEFEATRRGITRSQENGFITPGIGYTWFVGRRRALFVQPYFGAIVVVGRGDERVVGDVTVQLNRVFPNPVLALGWRF